MRMKKAFAVLIFGLFLLSLGISKNSPDGTLTGVITDPVGAIVQGVTIRVQHWKFDKNFDARAECDVLLYSDKSGRFAIQLPPGVYDLFVTSPGMSPVAKEVEVKSGKRTILNLAMAISPLVKILE